MKNRIKTLAYFLALVFFANMFGSSVALADSNRLEMTLPDSKDYRTAVQETENARTFKYWDISKEHEYSSEFAERDQLAIGLAKLTDQELDAKYPSYIVVGKLESDKLILDGIQEGHLYFRSSFSTGSMKYLSSFTMQVPLNGSNKIVLVDKIKSEPLQNGKVKLIKHDQNGKLLEGVGFDLYRITAGSEVRVPLIANYVYSESGSADQVLYTDKNGEISVTNLPYGDYKFKEVKALKGYKVVQEDSYFNLTSNELQEVKVLNEKSEVGGYKFLKIANDKEKTPLKGATFKVTQKVSGKYETILQNGKELILTSSSNGTFEVNNLKYGDYYLWEVSAPKGYKKTNTSNEIYSRGQK